MRGTQPTNAWRTTSGVARSAIIMVDHIHLSELEHPSQQQLSSQLAERYVQYAHVSKVFGLLMSSETSMTPRGLMRGT